MEIDARSPDGNSMFIMVAVRRLLFEVDRGDEWPGISARMMAGNYDNVCRVAEEVTYGSIVVVNRVNTKEESEG